MHKTFITITIFMHGYFLFHKLVLMMPVAEMLDPITRFIQVLIYLSKFVWMLPDSQPLIAITKYVLC